MLRRLDDAQLLNCQPDEIALVGPTSLALSFVAAGLKFRRSDNILIYHDDYPSNVDPWMALAETGVEVRRLNTRRLGVIRPKDVAGQIDENTRLVALASCHFSSGFRLEHNTIGKFLCERGILFGNTPAGRQRSQFIAFNNNIGMLCRQKGLGWRRWAGLGGVGF